MSLNIKHQTKLPLVVLFLAALSYPFWLNLFHQLIQQSAALASLALLPAFAIPALGIWAAWRVDLTVPARRFAYLLVAAPTIYVFMGVLSYMVKSQIADEAIWATLCIIAAGISLFAPTNMQQNTQQPSSWRVVHGVTAAVIVLYVGFHIINHLFALLGFEKHHEVQLVGEVIYRAPVVEYVLALVLVFQTITGARLFWHWSALKGDFFRTVQLATGIFLAFYVIGHMDSVFVFARSYIGTETNMAWAAGGSAGLLLDPWNIRLVPHYFLGVFFVLLHLLCGLRVVLLAHGKSESMLNKFFGVGAITSLAVAGLIMYAMFQGVAA